MLKCSFSLILNAVYWFRVLMMSDSNSKVLFRLKKLWHLYPMLLNSFWKDAILDWKQLLLGPILSLSTIWTKTTFTRTDTFKRIDALIVVALVASPLGQCGLNRNKHFYFASLLLPISENTDEHSKLWHNEKKKICGTWNLRKCNRWS